jgi:hypothetical protein
VLRDLQGKVRGLLKGVSHSRLLDRRPKTTTGEIESVRAKVPLGGAEQVSLSWPGWSQLGVVMCELETGRGPHAAASCGVIFLESPLLGEVPELTLTYEGCP